MAQITFVKKAQQRYTQIDVLNEDGTPQRTQMMDSRTGRPKVTKTGAFQYMPVRVRDLENPLPMPVCDKCSETIKVGSPYKHVSPKTGPYGGATRFRCGDCPAWQEWELSSSLNAMIAQIVDEAEREAFGADEADTITSALETAAASVRELALEKEEAAENVREGFGHDTSVSEELDEIADQLNGWADVIGDAEVPDYPEESECEECEGQGQGCGACEETGNVIDPTELDEWVRSAEDAMEVLQNCPV